MEKMYKRLVLFLVSQMLVFYSVRGQSIHEHKIKDVNGNEMRLSQCMGNKLLVFILSGQETDTTLLSQLAYFQNKYLGKVTIIGVPSIEEGYSDARKRWLKKNIKGKNINLFLTEAMYVKRSSGSNQSPFMNWLTDRKGNQHFDQEVSGAGQKFFLDEGGKLYAVVGSEVSLQISVIDRIMNRVPAK